ncbi:MAG: SDR family NAD(P)-dependent oxidoreductase [Acidimicrobiales bacterium]
MGAFDGKVALVTGGASGIGLAAVERFAADGATVVVADLNDGAGDTAATENGGRFVHLDVSDPEAWAQVMADVEQAEGGLDIIYLNAGVTTGNPDLSSLTDTQYRRIMGANVDGVVYGMRAAIPAMERRGGGAIVATASLAGIIAFAPDPIYTLTKHAVVGLVRSAAPQLLAKSITINAVNPGIVDTPLLGDEGKQRLEAAGFPLMAASEIASAVAGAITGGETGQCWVCQPGREPLPYEFGEAPGPRSEGARGVRPPGM